MNKIIIWLLILFSLITLSAIGYSESWFTLKESMILPFKSVLSAGFGGLLYLLRAVYVNKMPEETSGETALRIKEVIKYT